MAIVRNTLDNSKFNPAARLPFELRSEDFKLAMQDVYEFFFTFTEVYLGHVSKKDFRKNARGELGTRTATLHKDGIEKFRRNWIYRV